MDSSSTDDRLKAIENRLKAIEDQLGLSSPTVQFLSSAISEPPKEPAQEKEMSKPGNWLGIIAVICFVLAAGFIIKLSIETGWLTAARQIGLAYLLGIVLIGGGLFLLKLDREYASLLPGAGIIILYLTTFAAHQYYYLIPFETAIAVTSVVSAICVLLYRKIHHDIYAIISASGAYLSPIILGFHTETVFSLYYFLLCSFAFGMISIWLQSRLLILIAAYLAVLVHALIGYQLNQDELIAILLPIHFLIFVIANTVYTFVNHPLTEQEAWGFFPVLIFFYAMEYYFLEQVHPGLAPWISLAFSALLMLTYVLSKAQLGKEHLHSQAMLLAFATIVTFHSLYLELIPTDAKPWLFVIIMIIVGMLPVKNTLSDVFKIYGFPILATLAILGIEYLSIIFHIIGGNDWYWLLLCFAAFASIWFVILRQNDYLKNRPDIKYALLSATHLLAILGLYQLTDVYNSLAVSASWLLYAVAVMGFAFMRKDKVMAKSALFVLSFAAAKALLYDASSAPTTVRIFCLLLTGVVLYGSGFLMKKIGSWEVEKLSSHPH